MEPESWVWISGLSPLGGPWLGHWVSDDAVHCGRQRRGGANLMSEVPGTQAGDLDQASHLVNFVIFKSYLNKVLFFLKAARKEKSQG